MQADSLMKKLIIEKFRSVRAFSLASGIPRTTLIRILDNDISQMTVGTFVQICKTLDVDPALFLGLAEDSHLHIVACTEDEYRLIEQYRINPALGKAAARVLNIQNCHETSQE